MIAAVPGKKSVIVVLKYCPFCGSRLEMVPFNPGGRVELPLPKS